MHRWEQRVNNLLYFFKVSCDLKQCVVHCTVCYLFVYVLNFVYILMCVGVI